MVWDISTLDRLENLLLPPAAGRCDLASAHQVANVLLQELVVVIKLVVLLAHRLDATEYREEGVLQSLCVSARESATLFLDNQVSLLGLTSPFLLGPFCLVYRYPRWFFEDSLT